MTILAVLESRSAVKWSTLCPKTSCFGCTRESRGEAEPEVGCHVKEQLPSE
ncbi:rCG61211, partial [Rattus norvegicus]